MFWYWLSYKAISFVVAFIAGALMGALVSFACGPNLTPVLVTGALTGLIVDYTLFTAVVRFRDSRRSSSHVNG